MLGGSVRAPFHETNMVPRPHLARAGAVLATGRRTVASVLRATGRGDAPSFSSQHRVLSRRRRSGRAAARILLGLLLSAFVPTGAPVVVGLDETLERR